jgi:hypothetical protein
MIVGFLISIFAAAAIKYAFHDAYIFCRVMTAFLTGCGAKFKITLKKRSWLKKATGALHIV